MAEESAAGEVFVLAGFVAGGASDEDDFGGSRVGVRGRDAERDAALLFGEFSLRGSGEGEEECKDGEAHERSLTILGLYGKKNVEGLGLAEEDGVDIGFVVEGVGEDDDGVARLDKVALAEDGEGGADVGFGVTFFEGHLDGLDAASEG